MKLVLKKAALLIPVPLLVFFFCGFKIPADCDPEVLRSRLSVELRGFGFIKSFEIETKGSDDKKEFSYVLSKDETYRLAVADENEKGHKLVVTLLDRNKKVIATNYNRQRKEVSTFVEYVCEATGVYYIQASFQQNESACGLVVLAHKK
jgi:hypothetical protein